MTERITPEQIARIRAEYRAVVANTTNGGSGEDFATLAAWLIPALDEIERQATEIARLRKELLGALRWCESYLVTEPNILIPGLRDGLRAALAPPPAREEGMTTDG